MLLVRAYYNCVVSTVYVYCAEKDEFPQESTLSRFRMHKLKKRAEKYEPITIMTKQNMFTILASNSDIPPLILIQIEQDPIDALGKIPLLCVRSYEMTVFD